MWNIEELTGYKPQTTFWQDFSIADKFGPDAIRETFQKSFDEWKYNHIYLTELVLVLNWKMWQHNDLGNRILSSMYQKYWEVADNYAINNLKDEELSYFIRTTD